MSKPKIPPRNPIGDIFTGVVLQVENYFLLAPTPLPAMTIIHQGEMVIRYGVQYLMKPHSIVPGLIAAEYGDMLTGEEAWHFLLKRSNLYPRADVLGYRDDGKDDMTPIKSLDLMHPMDILIYENDEATVPLVKISAIIAPDADVVPERTREYATVYTSLAAWQEATP